METTTDHTRIAAARDHLTRAALLAELACESLSPVAGLAGPWERVRDLVFALRDERDRLEELAECPMT